MKNTEKITNCLSTPASSIDNKKSCHKHYLGHSMTCVGALQQNCILESNERNSTLKFSLSRQCLEDTLCELFPLICPIKLKIILLSSGMDFQILYSLETYLLMLGILCFVKGYHSHCHHKIHMMHFQMTENVNLSDYVN